MILPFYYFIKQLKEDLLTIGKCIEMFAKQISQFYIKPSGI